MDVVVGTLQGVLAMAQELVDNALAALDGALQRRFALTSMQILQLFGATAAVFILAFAMQVRFVFLCGDDVLNDTLFKLLIVVSLG